MCTLVLAHRCLPGAPVAIAANRDEFLARAASPPRLVPGPPRALVPRDEVAGGTWLGLNEHGLFVGITNRAGQPPDPSRQSRGLLVLEALRAPSAGKLHRLLERLDPGRYNPFHLLYADEAEAFVTWSDGAKVSQYRVERGVHVVTERSLGLDDRGRTERLQRFFEERVRGRTPSLARLHEILAVHGPDGEPFAGSCVHADERGYGTRSSFVYLSGVRPRAAWYEGKPCRVAPTDLSPLLEALRATSARAER